MAEVFVRLCNSEFVSLKKNFTVERDLVVETFAVRVRINLPKSLDLSFFFLKNNTLW